MQVLLVTQISIYDEFFNVLECWRGVSVIVFCLLIFTTVSNMTYDEVQLALYQLFVKSL